MSEFSWLDDFNEFSRSFLKVKNKAGQIVPFAMNEAQQFIHSRLEKQKATTGMVRAIVLKGRQQGCSTLIEGRFFHRTVTNFGIKTFILTHEQTATDNLFGMTQRYYEHYPDRLKPVLGAANAKELVFSGLDSRFTLATAGNKGAGRSSTAQLFHGSEVAYWPSAKDHQAGIMQAIPLEPGTEIIYESTANGVGDVFHEVWEQGEVGQGGWQSIFVPWFWQQEYRCDGVVLDDDDHEYGDIHGLDLQQKMWRRYKIQELGGDLRLFMREYPSTPAEAFSVSDERSLIDSKIVQIARKATANAQGPKILGVDPARFGLDKTVLTIRQGRCSEIVKRIGQQDTMQVSGLIIQAIAKYSPKAVFIDMGGLGAGIVDRLRELGYEKIVHGVNFGGTALDEDKYVNKRAEMWGLMKNWLNEQPVQISDDNSLEVDLCGLRYSYDSKGRLKLESKDEAKKRGIRSPDAGDSLALTFAMPVGDMDHSSAYEIDEYRPSVPGMGM